jgi:hypothetical protein
MTISIGRLYLTACRIHAAAEHHHRRDGYAAPVLLFLPTDGPGTLAALTDGIPQPQPLEAMARAARAVAILTTGEVWISAPGLPAEVMAAMPAADLPRPSQDPNRTEAIVTTAVGIGPDGTPLHLTRTSRIWRTSCGSMIQRAVDGVPGVRLDHAADAFAAALIRR